MNGSARIQMIDDDKELLELMTEYLGQHGYLLTTFVSPDDGLAQLSQQRPDLLILDVMLPKKSGFDLCEQIRSFSDVPIIMLTARGAIDDRVRGLNLGADDYLSKPFEPAELLARIQSILRRGRLIKTVRHLQFEDLSLDLEGKVAKLADAPLPLTAMEFSLLSYLASRVGEHVTRDQISEHLKGTETDGLSRSVDVFVSRLRGKLGDDGRNPRFIKTMWGKGYMFVGKQSEPTS